MKKIVRIFIAILLILGSACTASSPSVTPVTTPTPVLNKTEITKKILSGYSIVYPSDYNEYRMEDVYSLRDAIFQYVGSYIPVLSDKDPRPVKSIILADTTLQHQYSNRTGEFSGTLNSLIAVDQRTMDIVIGGSNYYATATAIERFNAMLPDSETVSFNVEYSENIVEIDDVPAIACTLKTLPFTTIEQFESMIGQGYNSVVIDASLYSERQLHNVIKWCAKYGVTIVMRSYVSRYLYQDCPIVLGHLIVNEPYGYDSYVWYSLDCQKYADSCAQYGWKPYVNIIGQDDVISELENNPNLFPTVDPMCVKMNSNKIVDTLSVLAKTNDVMDSADKDFVVGVDLSSAFRGYSLEDTALLRAVLGISFGAYGVQYFCYAGDGHSDESSYELSDASSIISTVKNLTNTLDGYEHVGAVYFSGFYTIAYGQTAYNDIFAKNIESYAVKDCLISDFVNEDGEHLFVVLNLSKDKELYFGAKDSSVSVINSDLIGQECDEFEVSGADFVVVKINAEE